jgi:ABC-2 type transport system permease protein
MTATSPTPAPAPNGSGSIYDLGYRGYDGPRLGRRHAIGALFAHTVLSCYGIGRGGRAKIIPFVLAGIAVLPAVVAVGLIALARQAGQAGEILTQASPIRYETYFDVVGQIVALFCAAQAPELLGRDQRYSVLSLYFSRALERTDYALAKLGGFVVALLALVLAPQLVLVIGITLSAPDLAEGLADNLPKVPAIVAQALTLSALFGALSLAIAAFTPRRAYATAGIIAAFIIPPVVAEISRQVTSREIARWFVLASPPDVTGATNAFFFDIRPESSTVAAARHPGELYLVVAVLAVLALGAILVRRYQRIAA